MQRQKTRKGSKANSTPSSGYTWANKHSRYVNVDEMTLVSALKPAFFYLFVQHPPTRPLHIPSPVTHKSYEKKREIRDSRHKKPRQNTFLSLSTLALFRPPSPSVYRTKQILKGYVVTSHPQDISPIKLLTRFVFFFQQPFPHPSELNK